MSNKQATPATDSTSVLKNFTPYKEKKGEEYMNESQKDHFKSILRSWRNQLMEEVDRTMHHLQDEAANYPDPADRATQEEIGIRRLEARPTADKCIDCKTLDEIREKQWGA